VPALNCTPGENSTSFIWVGIDGVGDTSVEQDGLVASCADGKPEYGAFYEMYGDPAVNGGCSEFLPIREYPVHAGDTLAMAVSFRGGTWTFVIDDSSAGWSDTIALPSPSPPPRRLSAEWVVERPELCVGPSGTHCPLATLPDFGTVTLQNAAASDGGASLPITSLSPGALKIVDNLGITLAGPSALDATGFAVSFDTRF
jgi:hypothetical protein